MLGIADRSKILELLSFVFQGNQENSIKHLRQMVNEGIEPQSFLNDLLEIIYFILQQKNLGDLDSDLSLSESQLKAINEISKDINSSTLIIFWQFILKGLEELSIVANPILSLEMLIIRLIHLKDMPKYDKILDLLNKNNTNKNDENITIKSYPKINLF